MTAVMSEADDGPGTPGVNPDEGRNSEQRVRIPPAHHSRSREFSAFSSNCAHARMLYFPCESPPDVAMTVVTLGEHLKRMAARGVERLSARPAERLLKLLRRQCLKRKPLPADIARTVLLAADESGACTNQSYVVDGRWM